MKRKCRLNSIHKLWILLMSIVFIVSSASAAINLDSTCYTSENPYYNSGYGGQCTAFAWGRACEKMGIKLQFKTQIQAYMYPHAKYWYEEGPIDSLNLQLGSDIRPNSIAIWEGDTVNPHGHVAYVERVEDGIVYFNEANTHPTYVDSDWGGGYNGYEKSRTIDAFEHRGSGIGNIIGYLYLTRLSPNDRQAVVLEAYYALSSTNMDGTSTNQINSRYYGDWNYIGSDEEAYNFIKEKLKGCSSNWTIDGNQPTLGCCLNCDYCKAGDDHDFYNNIQGYGFTENVGRSGQCKYFAHLIVYRAVEETKCIESYDCMETNSALIGDIPPLVQPKPGDVIFIPNYHTAIVVEVRKNDDGTLKEIVVIETNYSDPNRYPDGWSCKPDAGESNEAISKRTMTAVQATNYRVWQGVSYYDQEYTPSNLIDVALIIDSSGSMGWNDPQDLRKEAAKIFVDTAQNDDQIAIVDFDSWSYLRWPLQPLTENRDSIKSAVDLIDSSGGTSLSAGLIEGYNQLNSSTQPYKKAAVFLTDGVGSYNNEAELYKNEDNDNDCWPIYTIGLGYNTNPALLQSIADTTGGKYFALTDPDQLKNVYFEIATQISGGSSLMSESSVMSTGDTYIASVAVPAGQQSATFLTTWPGSDVNTTLTSPGGSEITPATSDPNIYYAKGLTYELYRITNPEAGIWTASLYGADLAAGGETVNISVSSVGPPVPEDTTPPVITISNPIDGKIYFDQVPTTFSFTVEDPETAVTSQTALLNGSPISNNDNILLSQLGENVLTITATNEANLSSELSIIFYVNHFSWLPPIRYQAESSTETLTSVIQANSTLPLKFAIFDATSSFVEDTTVKVVVEGTTAQFAHGEGDTNIRINQEEGEEPLYIVNIHTNFNKCDYGLEEGNEYWLAVYFDNILAAKAKMKIE